MYYRSKNIIKGPENGKNVSLDVVNVQKRKQNIDELRPGSNGNKVAELSLSFGVTFTLFYSRIRPICDQIRIFLGAMGYL